MHVISREATTQKAHLELLRALLAQIQVTATIGVAEQNGLAVDTALRDRVWRLGQRHTS